MNVLPVIVRELRAEARNSINYGMRLTAVAALMLVGGMFLWPARAYIFQGREVFAFISLFIFLGIWIFTPLLASDCLSREQREGTLGLLFLTPLRPIEIVLGKGFIHLLRGLTLIGATIPILTIPFLLGGVVAADILRVLCLFGTALFLSLAAGILGSSVCQSWMRSVVVTVAVLALFMYFFIYLPVAFSWMGPESFFRFLNDWDNVLEWLFLLGGGWRFGRVAPVLQPLETSALLCALSLLVFLWAILFATKRLRMAWRDQPPTARQARLKKVFLSPRFLPNLLRWKNRRRLTRNPVGWLQQYSWSARLSKWGWCLFIVLLDCWFVMDDFNRIDDWLGFSLFLLLASMAFSAVSSFQREKETGALELLLVTPLREKQIIFGRLWGIWTQFLPAFLVLVPSMIFAQTVIRRGDILGFLEVGRAFVLLPVVGLYFALRLKNTVAAWVVTALVYALLPALLPVWTDMLMEYLSDGDYRLYMLWKDRALAQWAGFSILSTIFSGITAVLLYRWLNKRLFALGR